MDQQNVRQLEAEIEKAVSEVVVRRGLKGLPLLPSQRTFHLMAKAAVAVYEAVAEEHRKSAADHDQQRPES